MLLAIDVGNSHTVLGVHDGQSWVDQWRIQTRPEMTDDELGSLLHSFFTQPDRYLKITKIAVSSVVPSFDEIIEKMSIKWLSFPPFFIDSRVELEMKILYDPPSSVGADRLANAVVVKKRYGCPAVVVDLGTATTLDAIDSDGNYLGGSILPGMKLSMENLFRRAAKLPKIELSTPDNAIGRNTTESLQSGIVLGTAGAIEYLVEIFKQQLGTQSRVIATGGFAALIAPSCPSIHVVDPDLTLDGIRMIAELNCI